MRVTNNIRKKLIEIVGSEDFTEEPRTLEEYMKDPGNPVLIDPKRSVAIIKPESLDEVKSVVKVLNEEKIPIVPRSCGLDYHGNTIPVVEGAVILDLSKMKKIVELFPTGEEGMCATVEPGVAVAVDGPAGNLVGKPGYKGCYSSQGQRLLTDLAQAPHSHILDL